MIRLALLLLALVNVIWYAQGATPPAGNLIAAVVDVLAAVGLDLINTVWKRVRA